MVSLEGSQDCSPCALNGENRRSLFSIFAIVCILESSRANPNDRLPRASLGWIEGGDGTVEGADGADVRPQSSVPHSLDDLTQLGTIGLDNEVDREAVVRPRLGGPDDGHQRSTGSNQARGPLPDVAADEIENQVDAADVFEDVVLEVDELLRAEVERLLAVGRASGADDVGARQPCELRHHRADCAGRAVREDALPRLKPAVLEESLPRGQARDRQARPHRELDVARQGREVARLDGRVLGEGAVASPVREAEHPLSDRQPRRAIAEGGDDSGQLMPRDRWCSITVEAIGPGRGPRHLSRDESRRMNLNDDIVYRCPRLGLTRLEFALLRYLMEREGKTVSRTDLLADVWGYRYEGDSNVIDVGIRALRRKLGERAKAISTVRGMGYRYRRL